MKVIHLVCLAIMALALTPQAMAQKFGHINAALLVESHPGIAKANADLETFRATVTAPFEAKAKAFQSKYQFYVEELQAGTLSRVTAETRQQELQTEQEALTKEEQQIQFAIMQKREELLQPILADLDSHIQAVAKEGQYTMIFDKSANGILIFAVDTDDLTETVRARVK
jgi:Skp family chaperone for outer membrane proteins